MLKLIVDFANMLIGAEGARLLREKRVKGDPTDLLLEEAPGPPAESERLERKSTGKFNRAYKLIEVVWLLILAKVRLPFILYSLALNRNVRLFSIRKQLKEQ